MLVDVLQCKYATICFKFLNQEFRTRGYTYPRGTQGRNEGGKGPEFLGRRITAGGRRKVPTVSQVLSLIQQICFRKSSGSNMGAPNLLLALGAI